MSRTGKGKIRWKRLKTQYHVSNCPIEKKKTTKNVQMQVITLYKLLLYKLQGVFFGLPANDNVLEG